MKGKWTTFTRFSVPFDVTNDKKEVKYRSSMRAIKS